MTGLEGEIRRILRGHGVRCHYRASAAPKGGVRPPPRYAVWAHGQQASEPASSADAARDREDLVVAALLALLAREPAPTTPAPEYPR